MRALFSMRDFRTVLGRRIVLLFIVSALVPTGWMAIETYRRVEQQLEQQAEEHVRSVIRSAGMALLDRLQLAETELDLVAQLAAMPIASRPDIPPLRMLTAVERIAADGTRDRLYGGNAGTIGSAAVPPAVSPPQTITPPHAASPPLAASQPRTASPPLAVAADGVVHTIAVENSPLGMRIHLGRPFDGGTLRATIDADSLLATARLHVAAAPPHGLCLIVADAQIGCPTALPTRLVAALDSVRAIPTRHATTRPVRWRMADGNEAVVGSWEVFLRDRHTAEPWLLTIALDRRALAAGADRFRWIYPRILLLALALVVALSAALIRRSLRPLEALTAAAHRVGQGSLDARVDVASRDEFGTVAEAFNAMAARLRRQFDALDALHRFDRAVLADPTRETIADAVLDHGVAANGSDAAAIWLRTEHGGVIHAATAGNASGKHRDFMNVPVAELPPPDSCHESDVAPAWLRGVPPFSVEPFTHFLTLPLGAGSPAGAIVLARYRRVATASGSYTGALQLRNQVSLALAAVQLVERLEKANAGALAALGRSVDLVSPWTAGHAERVAALSLAVGRQLGLEHAALDRLQRAALLHDIGKIGVPAAILDLPVGLRPEQLERLRSHVTLGGRVLEPIPAFADILPAVLHHHEHWDGSGYPAGLAGTDIDPLARIIIVADAFDGLTSEQPDRAALDAAAAFDRIAAGAGSEFEPAVVDALGAVLRRPRRSSAAPLQRALTPGAT